MMSVTEVREWLASLPDDAMVAVDDGGLCLQLVSDESVYCEVGGLPDHECDEDCELNSCGFTITEGTSHHD